MTCNYCKTNHTQDRCPSCGAPSKTSGRSSLFKRTAFGNLFIDPTKVDTKDLEQHGILYFYGNSNEVSNVILHIPSQEPK